MTTKREQLISWVLQADESMIDAVHTILMTADRTHSLNSPDNHPAPSSLLHDRPQQQPSIPNSYTQETTELNDEIKDIFGY